MNIQASELVIPGALQWEVMAKKLGLNPLLLVKHLQENILNT